MSYFFRLAATVIKQSMGHVYSPSANSSLSPPLPPSLPLSLPLSLPPAVLLLALLLCNLATFALGLYDHTDDVYELTPDNFKSMVLDREYVWVVEFYAPW